jgi:hypothetical protein
LSDPGFVEAFNFGFTKMVERIIKKQISEEEQNDCKQVMIYGGEEDIEWIGFKVRSA